MHAPRSGDSVWKFKDLTLNFAKDPEAGVTIEGHEKSGAINCQGVKYSFDKGKVQFTTETAAGGCLATNFEDKGDKYQVCCLLRNWSAVCPSCRLIHADEIRGG